MDFLQTGLEESSGDGLAILLQNGNGSLNDSDLLWQQRSSGN
jgi:hypothetical protein